jgi:hypothetical protein
MGGNMKINLVGFLLLLSCLFFLACDTSANRAKMGEACDGSGGITLCASGLACAHDGTCQDPGTGIDGSAGEGEACKITDECALGYVCGVDDVCIVGGVTPEGVSCKYSDECRYGLICNNDLVCGDAGSGSIGDACLGGGDCKANLVCARDGSCQDPEDPNVIGVKGPGQDCQATEECQLGLVCVFDGLCEPVRIWSGADCSASSQNAQDSEYPFKAYFEVPRSSQNVAEFYRLPFPNDVRIKNGLVDLSGHPAPTTPISKDLIASYLTEMESEINGFSTQQAVFFRFSKQLDYSTVQLSGENVSFYIINISPDSSGYGSGHSISMYGSSSQGSYICQNWLAMKPADGSPLRPATTYAVILTDDIKSSDGDNVARDDDFETILSDVEPSDSDLLAAWQVYQPLRDYLADTDKIDPTEKEHIVAAAVFTTMEPTAVMSGFRDKIRQCVGTDCDLLPTQVPTNLFLESIEEKYYKVNGEIAVPVFQKGTPPYVEQGGSIDFDQNGQPVIQGSQDVEFSLTIPKGTVPDQGWPLVIYAHGTGGGADSFINNGVAEKLSEVAVTLDSVTSTVQFAVLSIEGVQHGNRRGESEMSPDLLYFNFFNPPAAKYNAVQGAADNFQLVRMIEALNQAPIDVSDGSQTVNLKLDSNSIYYFGHSQGCLTGPLFLAFTSAVKTVVLSGAGGNLIQSLLTKTQPIDVASLTQFILGDIQVNSMHPMLNLLQMYFDPVDVVNYGTAMTSYPLQIGLSQDDPPLPLYANSKNVFMSYGRDDHFSTEATMASFARALGVQQVNDQNINCVCSDVCDTVGDDGLHTALCNINQLDETTTPVRQNRSGSGIPITSVLKMYLPGDYDGHYVLFRHSEGPGDYAGFLGSAIVDPQGSPTLFP